MTVPFNFYCRFHNSALLVKVLWFWGVTKVVSLTHPPPTGGQPDIEIKCHVSGNKSFCLCSKVSKHLISAHDVPFTYLFNKKNIYCYRLVSLGAVKVVVISFTSQFTIPYSNERGLNVKFDRQLLWWCVSRLTRTRQQTNNGKLFQVITCAAFLYKPYLEDGDQQRL